MPTCTAVHATHARRPQPGRDRRRGRGRAVLPGSGRPSRHTHSTNDRLSTGTCVRAGAADGGGGSEVDKGGVVGIVKKVFGFFQRPAGRSVERGDGAVARITGGDDVWVVAGSGGYCWSTPRHRLPCHSSNEGSNARQMTRRALGLADIARHGIGCRATPEPRVQNLKCVSLTWRAMSAGP
jgi:hypothetical protein